MFKIKKTNYYRLTFSLKRKKMALELDEKDKVVIPAKQEVVLDKLWIKQIVIQTPSPLAEGSIVLEYGPWDGDMQHDAVWRNASGEDITKRVQLSTLYASMMELPELYAAFDAILDAVKPLEAYIAQKEAQKEAVEEPVQE